MSLRLDIRVVDVREATDAEIEAGSLGSSPLAGLAGSTPPDGSALH